MFKIDLQYMACLALGGLAGGLGGGVIVLALGDLAGLGAVVGFVGGAIAGIIIRTWEERPPFASVAFGSLMVGLVLGLPGAYLFLLLIVWICGAGP